MHELAGLARDGADSPGDRVLRRRSRWRRRRLAAGVRHRCVPATPSRPEPHPAGRADDPVPRSRDLARTISHICILVYARL